MNRRGFLFAIPALAVLKPRDGWLRIPYKKLVIPYRPPTKFQWDHMTEAQRRAVGIASEEEWRDSVRSWRASFSNYNPDGTPRMVRPTGPFGQFDPEGGVLGRGTL